MGTSAYRDWMIIVCLVDHFFLTGEMGQGCWTVTAGGGHCRAESCAVDVTSDVSFTGTFRGLRRVAVAISGPCSRLRVSPPPAGCHVRWRAFLVRTNHHGRGR
jgi:hypothetical protein